MPCIPFPAGHYVKKGRSDIRKKTIGASHIHDNRYLVGKVTEVFEKHLDVRDRGQLCFRGNLVEEEQQARKALAVF